MLYSHINKIMEPRTKYKLPTHGELKAYQHRSWHKLQAATDELSKPNMLMLKLRTRHYAIIIWR